MDDAKRRALIRSQDVKKKETDEVAPKETSLSNPSTKRKQLPKRDHPAKKSKVPLEPVVGLMAKGAKTITPVKHGVGKGPMKTLSIDQEKPSVLLCEDSKHSLEQLSSIILSEDYEDLGNHSTKAMGETSLFAIAQVIQPFTFMSTLSSLLSNSAFSCVSSHGYDERADGTVSYP